jgi:tetratricopeptide (TPR) repeat protein
MSSFDDLPPSPDPELELRLALDSQAGPAARISKERARELVQAALAGLPAASALEQRDMATRPRAGRSHGLWLAAAALLLAFISGASASLWAWGKRTAERGGSTSVAPLRPTTPRYGAPTADPATPSPALERDVADQERVMQPPRPALRSRRVVAEALPEDLLQLANRKRAEGDFDAARDRYEQVVRRYPGTLSSYAAQVAAGSLELEHLAHPDAARRWFERALEARPRGALSLEALQGLAASLAALDRPRDERRALERLITEHPDTHAARRARERLAALRDVP